jgi:hypothetical protein
MHQHQSNSRTPKHHGFLLPPIINPSCCCLSLSSLSLPSPLSWHSCHHNSWCTNGAITSSAWVLLASFLRIHRLRLHHQHPHHHQYPHCLPRGPGRQRCDVVGQNCCVAGRVRAILDSPPSHFCRLHLHCPSLALLSPTSLFSASVFTSIAYVRSAAICAGHALTCSG